MQNSLNRTLVDIFLLAREDWVHSFTMPLLLQFHNSSSKYMFSQLVAEHVWTCYIMAEESQKQLKLQKHRRLADQ